MVHDSDDWPLVFQSGFPLVDFVHELAADLVDPEPVLPQLSVHVLPDAIRVSCQVVLSPDEVRDLNCVLFVFGRLLLPVGVGRFKEPFDQHRVVSWINAELVSAGGRVLLYEFIHYIL